MSAEWWDRHLNRTSASLGTPVSTVVPHKAVQWEEHYPPVRPALEPNPAEVGGEEMADYYRLRQQGFLGTAPPSVRDSGRCPGCGSGNFFRRRWASKECAPLCTDCGYNGDYFTQSGTLLNAVGMRGGGPMQFARSDNPGGDSQLDWSHPIRTS